MPSAKRIKTKVSKKMGKRQHLIEAALTEQTPTGPRDLGAGYIKAFVTFLDVLGFKELVAHSDPLKINMQLDAMVAFSQFGQRRVGVYATANLAPIVMQFSDSIVRVQPVPVEDGVDPYDLFVGEIAALGMVQGNLACNGILVRGGMTYGDVCVRESRVFGPSFVRAYEIESKLARYPRILVDETLCQPGENHPFSGNASRMTLNAASEVLRELLERNDDGQYAIQYLTHLFEAEHPEGVVNVDVLRAHRDSIEKLLSAVQGAKLEEPRAKVRWAASYHNRWIKRAFSRLDEQEFEDTNRGLYIDLI